MTECQQACSEIARELARLAQRADRLAKTYGDGSMARLGTAIEEAREIARERAGLR